MVAITAEELGLDMDEVKLVQPSGEGTTAPIAPAIANAIHMATGIEISELPLDPESIWRQLKNKRETTAKAGAKVS
jgi:CO/xanthine dehydrogenase Mo-binding subunit